MKMDTGEIYLKSPEEMKELFADYPEAIANTVSIAERCDVNIRMGEYHPVRYAIPGDFEGNADAYLAHVAREGLKER
jgi:DNA polymerase-3 subunit alpha